MYPTEQDTSNEDRPTSSNENVELLRAERDLLIREAHNLEGQIKQVQDSLISIERSFVGRIMNSYWDFLHWLFPIGSKRHLLGRKIWRTVLLWEDQLGWIGEKWKKLRENRRWVTSGGLILSQDVYKDLLEARQPINLEYRRFIHLNEPTPTELMEQVEESEKWVNMPRLSIVTALHTEDLDEIKALVSSIQVQTLLSWHWWVIVPRSLKQEIHTYLREVAKKDRRVFVRQGRSSTHIATNLNQGVDLAGGDYIVLLKDSDRLAPHALFTITQFIVKNAKPEFLYTDFDHLGQYRSRVDPVFKPDWSPEMMLSNNLLDPLAVVRKDVVSSVGGLREEVGEAYLWDFCLRITDLVKDPIHIPKILSHRQLAPDFTRFGVASRMLRKDSECTVVLQHLRRQGLRFPKADLTPVWRIRTSWDSLETPLVSIIIPTKDQAELLSRCINSLRSKTDYTNYEIIIVDNGSKEEETFRLYKKLREIEDFRILDYEGEFNFSRTINLGAKAANGEVLLFLNNDTEVLEPHWLKSMFQWFEIEGIGVVGAKLLFPDGRIQHGGVVVGMGGLAAHLFMEEEENVMSSFGSDQWYRNLQAVTAACMMVPKEIFDEVGGFDEAYQINYSDVDFCLKVILSGRRILYTPDARLLHHEGISHGKKIPRRDFELAANQWDDWGMLKGDPYFNPNLSYMSATPKFVVSKHDRPEDLRRALLARLPNKEMLELPEDLKR